jgi:hypothetical protein
MSNTGDPLEQLAARERNGLRLHYQVAARPNARNRRCQLRFMPGNEKAGKPCNSSFRLSTIASEAYELLTLIQQLTYPFQAFSFSIDTDQWFRAGKADEQPGLVGKEEAKTVCSICSQHF